MALFDPRVGRYNDQLKIDRLKPPGIHGDFMPSQPKLWDNIAKLGEKTGAAKSPANNLGKIVKEDGPVDAKDMFASPEMLKNLQSSLSLFMSGWNLASGKGLLRKR